MMFDQQKVEMLNNSVDVHTKGDLSHILEACIFGFCYLFFVVVYYLYSIDSLSERWGYILITKHYKEEFLKYPFTIAGRNFFLIAAGLGGLNMVLKCMLFSKKYTLERNKLA